MRIIRTLAFLSLFIGLAAINISQAGTGIKLPPVVETQAAATVEKQSISDVILHVFPENIASRDALTPSAARRRRCERRRWSKGASADATNGWNGSTGGWLGTGIATPRVRVLLRVRA